MIGFEALLILGRSDLNLIVPVVTHPIRIFLRKTSQSATGQASLIFVPKRSPVWTKASEPLVRGRASLLNFTGFEVGAYSKAGFELTAVGWNLTIIPIIEEILAHPQPRKMGRRRVTHQLEFSRADASSFTAPEMLSFLENVGQFFSFCHGGWIGLALAVGFTQDGTSETQAWGHTRIGRLSRPDSFLDKHHLECLAQLYPAFMTKMRDPDWADAISNVVYWLRRSELDSAGTDGGIILLQTALERFAWHVLVRDSGMFSRRAFEALSAADQIKHLLAKFNIPITVPDGLSELASFARSKTLDAPGALTTIRNRLVHPPKTSSLATAYPYYDAYRLGRWYIELAVLAACGYTGKYSNRTRAELWVGQVDDVPWA